MHSDIFLKKQTAGVCNIIIILLSCFRDSQTAKSTCGCRCFLLGTPEGTRIPDLPLRRRTLYPTELLAHIFRNLNIVTENSETVNKIRVIFSHGAHILSGKEVIAVNENQNTNRDLDDLIFEDEDYAPSQR